jgi:hypothetical protein
MPLERRPADDFAKRERARAIVYFLKYTSVQQFPAPLGSGYKHAGDKEGFPAIGEPLV